MRIIAGQRRGHKFDGPGTKLEMRPTSDLVRESLFNLVGPLMPEREVVDLFAGTGAIGLEALSRGAERATFVERNRDAVALIHRNIATLRYQDRTRVRLADAYRWGRTFEAVEGQVPLAVFLDPPYKEYEENAKAMTTLIAQLVEKLPPDSVIALEGGRNLGPAFLPDFHLWDIRRYGDTQIAIRVLGEEILGENPEDDDEDEGEDAEAEGRSDE